MRRLTPGVRSGCPGLRGLWRKLHWRNSKTTARRGGRLGVQLHATANTFNSGCHGRSGLEGLWGELHWRKARLCHGLGFDDRPGAVVSSRMDSDDQKYKTHTHVDCFIFFDLYRGPLYSPCDRMGILDYHAGTFVSLVRTGRGETVAISYVTRHVHVIHQSPVRFLIVENAHSIFLFPQPFG